MCNLFHSLCYATPSNSLQHATSHKTRKTQLLHIVLEWPQRSLRSTYERWPRYFALKGLPLPTKLCKLCHIIPNLKLLKNSLKRPSRPTSYSLSSDQKSQNKVKKCPPKKCDMEGNRSMAIWAIVKVVSALDHSAMRLWKVKKFKKMARTENSPFFSKWCGQSVEAHRCPVFLSFGFKLTLFSIAI